MRYLSEIRENERLLEHYLCKQKNTLKTKAGKDYYSLKLQDKTAVVSAKVWELHGDIGDFEENEMIKVDAVVLNYNGELQIKVNRIRKSLEGEYAIDDYIPRTEKDIDELYGKLLGFIDSVTEPFLRQLLELIILENEIISKAILKHSAAKHMHHSYLGGLLEHTISVVEICDFMSGRYKSINRDILITVAILHDIAKVYELSPMPANSYTDDGQMLGHIYLGAELISKECAKIPNFPHTLESLLKHAILSHHGEYLFGSPKLPMTIEAFILHLADNMDAKVKVYEDIVSPESTSKDPWMGYNKMLERYVRKSDYE